MIYRFDTLGSTNDEAQKSCYTHFDVVVAERQTSGRGQRGNKWISGVGLNLTLSLVLEPKELRARDQFLLSQITALSLCDTMRSYGIDCRIKWTNDIYVGDKKIVGILIENRLSGEYLSRSVVGIGINVNQLEFDSSLPNPISMAQAVEQMELNRDEVLERLQQAIVARYSQLEQGDVEPLREEYHSLIYRRDALHEFRLANGKSCLGMIRAVEPSGALQIEWQSGECCSYQFKEVEFIIG